MHDRLDQALRHGLHTDPTPFIAYAFRTLYPDRPFVSHWSIRLLGDALRRCHRREITRLVINLPPRTLKSFSASVAFPAWVHGVQPDAKIMCIAGHRGLAEDHHALTARLMDHARYRSVFPHVGIEESHGVIRLPHGGTRSAFTPSGAITGRGADMIIIDDPQALRATDEDADSGAIRAWYDRNVYQRLDSKHDGVIILVTQRIAHDDLTAHVLSQGDEWEVLSLPSIAIEDEFLPARLGGALVRTKGEALHEERESRADLRALLDRVCPEVFMTQYQQCPSDGQNYYGAGMYHAVTPAPDASPEEKRWPRPVIGPIPRRLVVAEQVFGEPSGYIIGGVPRPETVEEWLEMEEYQLKLIGVLPD